MKTMMALAALVAMMGSAQAATSRQAKALVVKAIQRSAKVADKQGPWRMKLQGKAGDKTRAFRISNIRKVQIARPGGGFFTLHAGGSAMGKINLKTNRVTIQRYLMVR